MLQPARIERNQTAYDSTSASRPAQLTASLTDEVSMPAVLVTWPLLLLRTRRFFPASYTSFSLPTFLQDSNVSTRETHCPEETPNNHRRMYLVVYIFNRVIGVRPPTMHLQK